MRYALTFAAGILLGFVGCWLIWAHLPRLEHGRPQDILAVVVVLVGLVFGAATIALAANGHSFTYNKNGFGFGGGEEFVVSAPLGLLSGAVALLILGATLVLWQP